MNATTRRLLLGAVFLFVLWMFWSQTRVIIFGTLWDLVVLLGVFALIFVALDHYFNHSRS